MNFVFLSVIGLIMVCLGLFLRFGGFKTWYLAKGTPILMPRAFQNILIPFGVTLIAMEIVWSDLVPSIQLGNRLFGIVVMPMFITSLLLAVWNPRWLRPRWLVYLEDTYGSVMWRLLDEARKNVPAWTRRVRTQQGLEEWAEETYLRLGYPPRQGKSNKQERSTRR